MYEHSKIYKLIDNTTGMFYIGSTARKRLNHRFNEHKSHSVNYNQKNYKLYTNFTHEKFCAGDIKLVLMEEVTVQNKDELHKIENGYIEKELGNPLCLNTRPSFVEGTKQEKRHQYYENNKESLRPLYREYREKNKEKVKEIKKRWEQENKEKVKEYKKRWEINNPYDCECGKIHLSRKNKKQHEQSQYHKNWVASQSKHEETQSELKSNINI